MLRKTFLLFLIPGALFAASDIVPVEESQIPIPWFTGPLLAPSAQVITVGHYDIQPYLYAYATTGKYNNDWDTRDLSTQWTLEEQTLFQVGLTEWMDFQFIPSGYWAYRSGQTNWGLTDWAFQLDFQLHTDELPHKSWLPSIRFTLRETIPVGKYRNLRASKQGTDIGGLGSWATAAQISFQKIYYLGGIRFVNFRWAFSFTVPAPVHVKGLNAYGGGAGTNGTVYPPLNYQLNFAFEYSLTRHWALAFDFFSFWNSGSRFKGNPGVLESGQTATNTLYAACQYSLAPALEYNWNEDLGVIFGSWFTIAGKNTPQFSSAVFSLNYYK
jgi:hypothetical protein